MSNFSNTLKSLRKSHNLTQSQFAAELNITQTAINYWENEKREPNLNMLQKIAEYFNVSLDYLITGKTHTEKKEDLYSKDDFMFGGITLDVTPENFKKYKHYFNLVFDAIIDNIKVSNIENVYDATTGQKISVLELKKNFKQADDDKKLSILEELVDHIIVNPIFNTFEIFYKLHL